MGLSASTKQSERCGSLWNVLDRKAFKLSPVIPRYSILKTTIRILGAHSSLHACAFLIDQYFSLYTSSL